MEEKAPSWRFFLYVFSLLREVRFGDLACLGIRRNIILVGRLGDICGTSHGLRNDFTHLQETATPLAESEIDNLIRCIQYARDVPTLVYRLIRQTQIRETRQVWLLKRQVLDSKQIHPRKVARKTRGIR